MITMLFFILFASECTINRAAFDIGSATTKLLVARVNECDTNLKKMEKVLFSKEIPLFFKEDSSKNNGSFSESFLADAVVSINKLKDEIKKFEIKKFNSYATAAFRSSKNQKEAVDYINKKTRINLRVISQRDELIFGLLSASAANNRNVAVWDIGGGSMQLSYMNGGVKSYLGELASISFKELVIKEITKTNSYSPNPLGPKYKQAVKLAEDNIKKEISIDFIKGLKNRTIIGIGGVFNSSLFFQLGKNSVTRSELEKVLIKRSTLTDEEIGGDYAATDITNMILVLGVMNITGIREVKFSNINMAYSAILE